MYRIGIDLGGTNIAVGVVDEGHRILGAASLPTRAQEGAAAVLEGIVRGVAEALAAAKVQKSDCAGAGLGAPGICDSAAGVVHGAHNLGWDGFRVTAPLSAALALPVFLGNDADCAALGEAMAGAAKGCESALMVTLGTGIGGGYVAGGRIQSGFRGRGGEFGHMCIQMGGEACTCGQKGCWEAYASATALIRQARAAAQAAPSSALNRTEIDGRSIYEAAAAGDETALAVTARYAEYVGVGLVSCINALFPEVVLLGGGVSGAGEALLAPLRRYVADHAFVRDAAALPLIRAAALGSDAGIIGAAALAP